ncbi:hypothetical protein A7A08_01096 [Methyloligella halotolerans]|uniref:Extensin-like C-terminal domain-containing protein n=1 Tax=Methyloligella halotolerans TaxID=1177755 RepID=A0A1E2S0R6_9HYPH|nr:extensin family protein [Methyloligella halotolerans]ODA67928.1 hypothetical protein A7A08_01096 [Methyloligella halotolerans]
MLGLGAILAGCSMNPFGASRGEWRSKGEARCMASGVVQRSPYIQEIGNVKGGGACGMDRPLRVSALVGGRVKVEPAATMNCPVTVKVDEWVYKVVQPAANRWFRQPVVEIKQMASYSCRSRNGVRGAKASEHAFGNALDVGGFTLADGSTISVKGDWSRGSAAQRAFLREVYNGACDMFHTVLGPGGDRHHGDHIHIDLLISNGANGSNYCRPRKQNVPDLRYAPQTPMASVPGAQQPINPLSFGQ